MGVITKEEGRFWGYAYVKPRTEKKVQSALESRAIPNYLPTVAKARMHHSTKITTHHPMLPGYIFLCITDEERRELKTAEKQIVQIELLREEHLEEEFINELNILKRCEELAQTKPVVINPDIVAGDKVTIISGPLQGLETTVESRSSSSDKVIINLMMLNVNITCPISAENLKKTS